MNRQDYAFSLGVGTVSFLFLPLFAVLGALLTGLVVIVAALGCGALVLAAPCALFWGVLGRFANFEPSRSNPLHEG